MTAGYVDRKSAARGVISRPDRPHPGADQFSSARTHHREPYQGSDVDVLVVMPRAKRHGRRPSLAIRRSVSAGLPVDILVKEPREIARRLRNKGDTFLREITEKGRVMYEAGHA